MRVILQGRPSGIGGSMGGSTGRKERAEQRLMQEPIFGQENDGFAGQSIPQISKRPANQPRIELWQLVSYETPNLTSKGWKPAR